MVTFKDLSTPAKNTWCPGCGNFSILNAFKRAIVKLYLNPEKILIISGIGCHGKITDYINVNSIHVIHGRVLPVATGAKLANHELIVIGFAGDGDAYSIGLGHLPHAARRNIDILYIVHDNMVFGLTTGQATPTSPLGLKTRSTPFGVIENPLNPLALVIACGATFVARGYSGDINHLTWLIMEGLKHRGFAFIDVLQPCVTFYNTYQYFSKRVYRLEDVGWNPTNRLKAYKKTFEWGDKIPIGIFYKGREETLVERLPQLKEKPLIKHGLKTNISKILEKYL